jgi:type VI secretion system protein ImpM
MSAYGAYGKIPSLGDFFRLQLGPDFIDPWDNWLQNGMLKVGAILGEDWEACYMSAPIWRFTLSPGQAGPNAVMGVMMASVDRVGRKFPLTLCLPLPSGISPVQAHFYAEDTLMQLENIALEALEDSYTRDMLATSLEGLHVLSEINIPKAGRGRGKLTLISNNTQEMYSAFATHTLSGFTEPSVWSAMFETEMRLMTIEGLPNTDQMHGLFDVSAPVWQTSSHQEGGT